MMVTMILAAVTVVSTSPLLSVSCFYTTLHCYDVTITNKHTCKNKKHAEYQRYVPSASTSSLI